jgi:hypothetical protein
MTAEEKIFAVLSVNSPLLARVPKGRIKVPGDWQSLDLPYIVHFPVAAETIHCHDGLKALRIWHFYQVSIFAARHSDARAIADLVVTALDGYHDADVDRIALVRPPFSVEYDTDRKVAHVAIDFQVAGALT